MGTLNLGDILSQRETIAREMQVDFTFFFRLSQQLFTQLGEIRCIHFWGICSQQKTLQLNFQEHPDQLQTGPKTFANVCVLDFQDSSPPTSVSAGGGKCLFCVT